MNSFQITSPSTGQVLFEKALATSKDINLAIETAKLAQTTWQALSLEQRIEYIQKWLDQLESCQMDAAREITEQMGRPIRYTPGEMQGMRHRADYLIKIASKALETIDCEGELSSGTPPFEVKRYMKKAPLGLVLIIAPWNYPYLTVINALVPALLAGNVVLLKHAPQTALCGERIAKAAIEAGLPEGIIQSLMIAPDDIATLIVKNKVDGVSFTGSVTVGQTIHRLASEHLLPTNLELGGKDAAYVRHDADIAFAANKIADGAFFNSGQSCCGIERIFVDEKIFAPFVEAFEQEMNALVVGDPFDEKTTIGPVANQDIVERVQRHIKQATQHGAKHIALKPFDSPGFYVTPSYLVDVTTDMALMQEETFGPIVGIMPVKHDDDAIKYVNDSDFGLTASVWTRNIDEIQPWLNQLKVGTTFLNQCDVLDPSLAWTGFKQSGLGTSLSIKGFDAFTQLKSYYLRLTC